MLDSREAWQEGPLLRRREQLPLVGKLGGWEAVAAVSCGPKGQLALLVDEASQQRFLVDTGSSYSILPHKSQQPHSGPRLCTADRSPIPCLGGRKVHVAAGGRGFSWTFLLADVALPIIGADFWKHFGLLVDIGEMRLLARGGGWKHHLVGPSANSLFPTLGVVADQSSSSSSSPSLLTVEARSSGSSLQHMLKEFPSDLQSFSKAHTQGRAHPGDRG